MFDRVSPQRPPAQRIAVVVATTCALLLVASCSRSESIDTSKATSTTTATPTTTDTSGTDGKESTASTAQPASAANGFPASWKPAPLKWSACSALPGSECATLAVPLDWSQPTGPTVSLALGRQKATGKRIGSLLSNPGGPGGSGLELLTYDAFSPTLTESFDIVSWDPRGVGQSTRAKCGGGIGPFLANDPDPDTPQESVAIDAAAKAVAEGCAKESGDLLAHIGTDDVTRDLEAIRRALGNEPLNFLGFSYGTQIGQKYAEFFPKNIRTMTLDGVVDPRLGYTEFLLGQAKAFDDAFNRSANECADAGVSNCGVRDLAASYDRVRARVELSPLPAGRSKLGPAELATAATYVAYLEEGWAQLGPALAAAEKGKGTQLKELADSYYDLAGYPTYAAVTCVDTPPPKGSAEYKKFTEAALGVSARFGGAVANELLPCAFWTVPPKGTPGPVNAAGAPPILVVGNTGDPATPYSNAVTVARDLPGAVLLTADIGGHTAYGTNSCVTSAVDSYFVSKELPKAGTRCSK